MNGILATFDFTDKDRTLLAIPEGTQSLDLTIITSTGYDFVPKAVRYEVTP
jgi:hypothetical protein